MITDIISSPSFIWIAMIVVMLLSLLVSNMLQKRFAKYSEVPINASGAEIAQRMLASNGIHDVQITCIEGSLTDHYNPKTRTVNLSKDVYYGKHVAAAAVAAHECGHVIQHQAGYAPLKLRSAMVPMVSFANKIVSWVLLAGVLLVEAFPGLLWVGIFLFAMTTLFSFVTLPVEINASVRAVGWLEDAGIVSYDTRDMAKDALKWAAYTYVIAAIGSLATLLYYISIARGRR